MDQCLHLNSRGRGHIIPRGSTNAPYLNLRGEGEYHTKRTNAPYLNSRGGGGHIIPRGPMPPPKFKREGAYHTNYDLHQCLLPKFEGRGCISWTNAPYLNSRGRGTYHTKRTNVPYLNSKSEGGTKRTNAPYLNLRGRGAYHTKRTNAPYLNSRGRGHISYQVDQCPPPKFMEGGKISYMYMYQEDQRPLPKFKGRGCISYQEDQCPLSKFKGEGAYHTKRTNVPPPKFKEGGGISYMHVYQED